MNGRNYETAHEHIVGLMRKIKKPARGFFKSPYLSVTAGKFYSAGIFSWDDHFMTLRFAADGQPEQMKYFLLNMLAFQTEDGFVPNCPSAVSGIAGSDPLFHAQPFLAQNAAICFAKTGDAEFASSVYGKLEKYLDYWFRTFSAPHGLFRWGATWMSGFDNEIAGTIFEPGTILPPDLPSWLYLECRAMAYLAGKLGFDGAKYSTSAERIAKAVNEFQWDESMGCYSSFRLNSEKVVTSWPETSLGSEVGKYAYVSCPGLIPLYAGIAPADRAMRMIREYALSEKHFRSRFGIRSLSRSSEYYNNARWGNPPRFTDWRRLTNSNWQGPVWVPLTWFVFHALLRNGLRDDAARLADDMLGTIAESVRNFGFMRENFDAETGEPLYADDFASWNILADLMPEYLKGKTAPLNLFPWEE